MLPKKRSYKRKLITVYTQRFSDVVGERMHDGYQQEDLKTKIVGCEVYF